MEPLISEIVLFVYVEFWGSKKGNTEAGFF